VSGRRGTSPQSPNNRLPIVAVGPRQRSDCRDGDDKLCRELAFDLLIGGNQTVARNETFAKLNIVPVDPFFRGSPSRSYPAPAGASAGRFHFQAANA